MTASSSSTDTERPARSAFDRTPTTPPDPSLVESEVRVRSGRGRPVGKRRRAREMAVQMLYQLELGRTTSDQVFAEFDVADYLLETEIDEDEGAPRPGERQRAEAEVAFEYARSLVHGTLADGDAIDQRIRRHAENWRLERMPAIDRNILRLAIYEMIHEAGVPKVVIVDEAIELAKRFGSENSGRFVNGLLDGVLKAVAAGESDEAPSGTDG